VQAVGSVLAIAAALWIGQRQVRAVLNQEERKVQHENGKACSATAVVIDAAIETLEDIKLHTTAESTVRQHFFTSKIRERAKAVQTLLDLPNLTANLPNSKLVSQMIHARLGWINVVVNIDAMYDHFTAGRQISSPAMQLKSSTDLIPALKDFKISLEEEARRRVEPTF